MKYLLLMAASACMALITGERMPTIAPDLFAVPLGDGYFEKETA